MDFNLTEEQLAIQQVAKDFAEKEIMPTVDADDKAHRFQRELILKMGEIGLLGCPVPIEYGGSESGYLAHALVVEQIAGASSALRIPFNSLTMGPAATILNYGTEEQKQKYIPKLVSGEMIGCFAITEPDAGSDVAAMRATADADGEHYIINGTKTWATFSTVADVFLVYCYTDKSQKHRGLSAFIIENGASGISATDFEKMGVHAAPTGELFLDDVRVPKENLLGKEGQGFRIVMGTLNGTRLTTAAGAVGIAQACLDAAVSYAADREQFGQKVGNFQMNQQKIADMVMEIEAARLLTYRCAWQKDQGMLNNNLETSIAKCYAADVAAKASDYAMLIYGAYGYSAEYPVERYYRDAKLYQIIEGSSNILRTVIAQDALGFRKANR